MHLDCVFSIIGDDVCIMMDEMMGESSPTRRLVDEWVRSTNVPCTAIGSLPRYGAIKALLRLVTFCSAYGTGTCLACQAAGILHAHGRPMQSSVSLTVHARCVTRRAGNMRRRRRALSSHAT